MAAAGDTAYAQSNKQACLQLIKSAFKSSVGKGATATFAGVAALPDAANFGQYLSENLAGQLSAFDQSMLAALAATQNASLSSAIVSGLTGVALTPAQQSAVANFVSQMSTNLFVQSLQAAGDYLAMPSNLATLQNYIAAAPSTELFSLEVPNSLGSGYPLLDQIFTDFSIIKKDPNFTGSNALNTDLIDLGLQPEYAQALQSIAALPLALFVPYYALPYYQPAANRRASTLYQCEIGPLQEAQQMLTFAAAICAVLVVTATVISLATPTVLVVGSLVIGGLVSFGAAAVTAVNAIYPDCDNDGENKLLDAGECSENGCNGSPPSSTEIFQGRLERAEVDRLWRLHGSKPDLFHRLKVERLPPLPLKH